MSLQGRKRLALRSVPKDILKAICKLLSGPMTKLDSGNECIELIQKAKVFPAILTKGPI